MITGDECGPNFLTFVLRLREIPGKNLNQEIDPTGDLTRARCARSNDVTVVVVLYKKKILNVCTHLRIMYPPQKLTLNLAFSKITQ